MSTAGIGRKQASETRLSSELGLGLSFFRDLIVTGVELLEVFYMSWANVAVTQKNIKAC
jgi:hypothetical protein